MSELIKVHMAITSLFVIIALLAIYLAFQPAVMKYEVLGLGEVVTAPKAQTVLGAQLRAKAWLEYPKYNIGLGIIALMSFVGACYSAGTMFKLEKVVHDALQSKISGV